jgi:3',5'-cyclic AMP phosphodiesterase CpdA
VVGDSRDGPEVYQTILEAVSADGSQFLIHTGDLVNTGSESEFIAFDEMMNGFGLPFYPVPGNHDALAGDLTWFLRYSGAPAAHYSFDWGAVHVTLADSHHGVLPQAELQWIRKDLTESAQPVKVVVVHHPPYDPDGSSHILAGGNQAFLGLMSEQGVDYVFCGHIHAFAIDERDGTVYVITGGGGAPLYTAGHPQAYHHYVRASVQPDETGNLKMDVEVVPISP